jgi:cell division protein FtsW
MVNKLFGSKPQKRNERQYTSRASSSGLSAGTLSRKHRPDYSLLIIALLLSVIGLIVVYAISPGLAATKHVSTNYFVIKQTIAIALGLAAFAVCSYLPVVALKKLKVILIWTAFAGALAVFFFGEEINGASRWMQIGGLSFQIAEMIKFALIVWLCAFFTERMKKGEIADSNKTLRPLLIVMLIIGIIVAKIESDLGSTGVMIAIIGVLAFTSGLPLKRLFMIAGIVLIGTLLAVSTSSYRRDRVATFLNPSSDCQASGYQSCQALIAVGSGGVFGLGLGNGVQAYGYLPEAANDSIFAILAEKFGFLGISIVMGLYLLLFSRFKRVIERTQDPFSRLFVTGVLAWLSTQAIINIGAMIGLLPLKGITLPFISYGGTSILFVMAALGVVFQISRYTSFEPIRSAKQNTNAKEQAYEDRTMRRRVGRPYYAASGRRV